VLQCKYAQVGTFSDYPPDFAPGTLRDLSKRRLPGDDLAEKVAAERFLEHLELCGWRMEHKPAPPVTPSR